MPGGLLKARELGGGQGLLVQKPRRRQRGIGQRKARIGAANVANEPQGPVAFRASGISRRCDETDGLPAAGRKREIPRHRPASLCATR